jgi:hypothetical protein
MKSETYTSNIYVIAQEMSAFGHGIEMCANFLQKSMHDDLQQFALLGTKNEALACCSRRDNRHCSRCFLSTRRDCEVISVFCVVYASECPPMFLAPLVSSFRSSFAESVL